MVIGLDYNLGTYD